MAFPWFCLPCPFLRLSGGEGSDGSHHMKVGTEVFDSVAQAGSESSRCRSSDHLPVLPRSVTTEPLQTSIGLHIESISGCSTINGKGRAVVYSRYQCNAYDYHLKSLKFYYVMSLVYYVAPLAGLTNQ